MDFQLLTVVLVTLVAATVNGALGYGFSSTTLPVALLFYTNRVLNPALVLVEVVVNGYSLMMNRQSVPVVWKRAAPIILGLLPGVILGGYWLSVLHPDWVKLFTFTILLPLTLLQVGGIRRPIRAERTVGVPFGTGLGVLYSVTTVSGPPLALLFNNQGLVKRDFRAALGLIRMVQAIFTAATYYTLGLYSARSMQILWMIIPSVVVGIPLGYFIVQRLNPETFRRVCMSFDAWVVGFGLSRLLVELSLIASPAAYTVWLVVVLIDSWLLYRYFRLNLSARPDRVLREGAHSPPEGLAPGGSAETDGRGDGTGRRVVRMPEKQRRDHGR